MAEEADKNEIQYSNNEMKEMNQLRARKQSAAQQEDAEAFEDKATQRCCGLLKSKPKRRATMSFDT